MNFVFLTQFTKELDDKRHNFDYKQMRTLKELLKIHIQIKGTVFAKKKHNGTQLHNQSNAQKKINQRLKQRS